MRISLLLNSREKDRQNLGNIFEWTNTVRESVSSLDNVEIIIKYDLDDDASHPVIQKLKDDNQDMLIKTFHTDRVGYGGQHIGYQEGVAYIEPDSVIMYPMPDDIFFAPNTQWDLPMLDHARKYSDGVFLVKMAPLENFTDVILFSTPLIKQIGFGPKFAVDQWGYSLCQMFIRLGIQDRVLCLPEHARRRPSNMDHFGLCPEADARWYGDRQDMMDYLATPAYASILQNVEEIIKQHLNL